RDRDCDDCYPNPRQDATHRLLLSFGYARRPLPGPFPGDHRSNDVVPRDPLRTLPSRCASLFGGWTLQPPSPEYRRNGLVKRPTITRPAPTSTPSRRSRSRASRPSRELGPLASPEPSSGPARRLAHGPRANHVLPANGDVCQKSSKPVRRGSPTLGRFDSCAAPSAPDAHNRLRRRGEPEQAQLPRVFDRAEEAVVVERHARDAVGPDA